MPRQKGMLLRPENISSVSIKHKVDVGHTKTITTWMPYREADRPNVPRDFYSAKLHFNESIPAGKRKTKRVFLKPANAFSLEGRIKVSNATIKIADKLRTAGLPVPKMGVVYVDGNPLIAIEPYLRKGDKLSRIQPINPGNMKPEFLKNLSVQKNKSLIMDLAKDLATIANLGLSTNFFDFHGFYKRKDGSFQRVIIDINEFHQARFDPRSVGAISYEIRKVWGSLKYTKELHLFAETLFKNIESYEVRMLFKEELIEKSSFGWVRRKLFFNKT